MTQLNPFTGSILQSPVVQQQQQTLRQQQVEHQQHLRRNAAAGSGDDKDAHEVENTEEVTPIHDEEPDHTPNRHPRKRQHAEDQVELSSVASEPDEGIAVSSTDTDSAQPIPSPEMTASATHASANAATLAHRPATPAMPSPAASGATPNADQHHPLDIKA